MIIISLLWVLLGLVHFVYCDFAFWPRILPFAMDIPCDWGKCRKVSLCNIDLISCFDYHHFTSLDLVKVCPFNQPWPSQLTKKLDIDMGIPCGWGKFGRYYWPNFMLQLPFLHFESVYGFFILSILTYLFYPEN